MPDAPEALPKDTSSFVAQCLPIRQEGLPVRPEPRFLNTSPLQRSDSLPGGSRPVIISHLALTPGTRLGPYEITAQRGAGGMGEACRATDTKLDRDVAV